MFCSLGIGMPNSVAQGSWRAVVGTALLLRFRQRRYFCMWNSVTPPCCSTLIGVPAIVN
jgi:hypothetical protein